MVKWANQVPSPETLYQTVIRAGEMAKRQPRGPVYLNLPVETMMHGWTPPPRLRDTPEPPKTQALPADVAKIAALIAKAKCPVIVTESVGRDPDAFAALIEFAELMAIPVIEGRAAAYANFPKSHPLHLGTNIAALHKETDFALLIESRVPWYPPSNLPPNAKIVAISENPLKDHMVYQTMEADHYLEGDVAQSLRLLTAGLRHNGVTSATHADRRERWQAEHDKLIARRKATRTKPGKPTRSRPRSSAARSTMCCRRTRFSSTRRSCTARSSAICWNGTSRTAFSASRAGSARDWASRSAPNSRRPSGRWSC